VSLNKLIIEKEYITKKRNDLINKRDIKLLDQDYKGAKKILAEIHPFTIKLNKILKAIAKRKLDPNEEGL
jgi:hypothetical protein